MGLLDRLKTMATDARSGIEAEVSKFKNKDVLDAIVGASVMIATADGKIDASEKQKLLAFLQSSALTKAYPTDLVIAKFNEHADRFGWDADVGKAEALRIIGRQRENPDAARTVVRVAVMIAAADGNFDATERKAVSEIIRTLGLTEQEFDL